MKEYLIVRKNSLVFRASDTEERNPVVSTCPDTGKTGAYFSLYYSYLSEVRVTEEMKDKYINMYHTTQDMLINYGKYGFTDNYSGRYSEPNWIVAPEDNISHVDDRIISIDPNVVDFGDPYKDEKHMELFLVEEDLSNLNFIDSWKLTIGECVRRWYKQSWFEQMANDYMYTPDGDRLRDVRDLPPINKENENLYYDNKY